MAAFEDNFIYSDYVSDDGNTYSIRTLADAQADAGLALTASSAHPAYGPRSRRHSPRMAVYADLTAPGRRVSYPIGTAAAFTTLTASLGTVPATHARRVRGEVAAKTYTLVATHAEKVSHHVILSSAAQGT